MTPLLALTVVSATMIVCVCSLAAYVVHVTGSTTGIGDVARAVGGLLSAFVTAVSRLL